MTRVAVQFKKAHIKKNTENCRWTPQERESSGWRDRQQWYMSSDGAEALIKLELIVACSSLCLCMTEDPGGTKARPETREE